MDKYRLYRREFETNKWEKTSFIGNRRVIDDIMKSLSRSKYHQYSVRKEI